MAWVEKNCFVVTAFYRDELYQENETPMKEEKVFFIESEAEKCKEELEADTDFEAVYIEEEKREFWVDEDEARRMELKKMDVGVLIAALDDEVQKLARQSNEEWARTVSQSCYLDIRKEISRRLKNE